MPATKCKACGGEMVQKRRTRLLIVGVIMLASMGSAGFTSYLRLPAAILGLTGIYLIAWATLGKGNWCRNCKKW